MSYPSIFITGDCHFQFSKLNRKNFPISDHLTKEDIVIVCGDFGIGPWFRNEKENEYWLNWLEERSFTLAFCDGNHENYDTLDSLPVIEWNGGKVHFVREHVIHLMRGQYYAIGTKTFWVLGGARSHDISDGILDPEDPMFRKKRRELDERFASYRIKHQTQWEREMPSEEEFLEGRQTLVSHGNKVDYIITHTAAWRVLRRWFPDEKEDRLSAFLENIEADTEYEHWYFGHFHADLDIDEKHTLLCDNIIRVGDLSTNALRPLAKDRKRNYS